MTKMQREPLREADGKLKRPCIEEFVAAHYPAEDYDKHFSEENYGPGWSDPSWAPEGTKYADEADLSEYESAVAAAVKEMPTEFHVHSKVRHVSTRTTRVQQPTRHRFKQYLFADPSKRLVRRRPVRISSDQLVRNIDELIQKEEAGILSVHLMDGRRIDLKQLRVGIPAVAEGRPTPPLYNRRLDSAAYDTPAGIPLPQYLDGTFPGDPAAQRATERMVAEKQHEAARQGADEDDGEAPDGILDNEEAMAETAEEFATAETLAPTTEAIPDVSDLETAAPPVESITVDPAAARGVDANRNKKGGKRR